MAGQIAILEGWKEPKMPRKRKRGGAKTSFAIAAKKCRRRHKKSPSAFWKCVKRLQGKGRRGGGGRRRKSRRGRSCPPGCKKA